MICYACRGKSGRSVHRLNKDGIVEAPEAAMLSGGGIMSGFIGPVGWWETAYTRGAFHYAKLTGQRSVGILEENGTTFSD